MSVQRESKLVVNPFKIYLESKGWYCANITCNQYMMGLPDMFAIRKGRQIWIEFKVIEEDGSIHTTPAQKDRFPTLLAYGTPIYAICAMDLRPATKKKAQEIAWLYSSIIMNKIPNGGDLFKKIKWPQLNPFCKKIPISKRKKK